MKFRTRSNTAYDKPKPIEFPHVRPTYRRVVGKDGQETVKLVGESNFYEQIQEAAPDTLIYNLIDQYNRTGNGSIFGNPSIGGFIDATTMPRDLMEAENIRVEARQLFDALPLEERKKYGQNFGLFLADVNTQIAAKTVQAAQDARAKIQSGAQEVTNA